MTKTEKAIVTIVTVIGAICGAAGFGALADFIFPAILGGGLFGVIICGGCSILCIDGEYYPNCDGNILVPADNHDSDADSTVIGDNDNQEEV